MSGCPEKHGFNAQGGTSPQSGIKSSFSGPSFVLAPAGIRRVVIQIQGNGTGDLAYMSGCPETHGFDVQGGGVRLISGCYLSTFDTCQLSTIGQRLLSHYGSGSGHGACHRNPKSEIMPQFETRTPEPWTLDLEPCPLNESIPCCLGQFPAAQVNSLLI